MRRRRIVVVDDELNIGLSLQLILEGEGFAVTLFESATAFLAEYRAGRSDLFLIDEAVGSIGA